MLIMTNSLKNNEPYVPQKKTEPIGCLLNKQIIIAIKIMLNEKTSVLSAMRHLTSLIHLSEAAVINSASKV